MPTMAAASGTSPAALGPYVVPVVNLPEHRDAPNLSTVGFMEPGAAIAPGRPYLFFNFQNQRTVPIGHRNEQLSTPSDLAGMLCLGRL